MLYERQAYGGNGEDKPGVTLQPQREGYGLCGSVPGNIVITKWSGTYNTLGFRGPSPEDGLDIRNSIPTRHNMYLLAGLGRATLYPCYGAARPFFSQVTTVTANG